MPIYEYGCQSCGHKLDALQKMSEPPLTDCPECGDAALKRLISAPRFRLKGSGWYETDFKQGNQRNLAKGDSEKGDGDKAGSGDKADKGDAAKKDGDTGSPKTSNGAPSKTESGTTAAKRSADKAS